MARPNLSLRGEIAPFTYAVLAPALVFSQHLAVALTFRAAGMTVRSDALFWLLPLRRLSVLPGMSPWFAALAFAFSLAVAWALAVLSYRRASTSTVGYMPAALSVVPGIQLAAIALLVFAPVRAAAVEVEPEAGAGAHIAHVLQGLFAGMAILVFAVLVSAVTLGSYGWGLFIMTPFLVGLTTAYLANREVAMPSGQSRSVVLMAAALGGGALLMFALEGFICILLLAPLGAAAALAGGALGREAAAVGHRLRCEVDLQYTTAGWLSGGFRGVQDWGRIDPHVASICEAGVRAAPAQNGVNFTGRNATLLMRTGRDHQWGVGGGNVVQMDA